MSLAPPGLVQQDRPPLARGRTPTRGAGLIEALVATAIVVTAAATLASLSSLALRTVQAGRDRTLGTMLARARLDSLITSPVMPPVSPADSLDRDTQGFAEQIDAAGYVAGQDPGHAGAVFVRRWRVTPVPGRPGAALITVQVFRCTQNAQVPAGCPTSAFAVRLSGVRSAMVR